MRDKDVVQARGKGAAPAQVAPTPGKRTNVDVDEEGHDLQAAGPAAGVESEKADEPGEVRPAAPQPGADKTKPPLQLGGAKPEAGKQAVDGTGRGEGDGEIQGSGDGQDGQAAPADGAQNGGAAPAVAATVTHTTIDTAPGAPDTRLTVGVGEKINFESDVAGNWTANLSRRTANARNTTTFQWNAPTRPGSATITFTAGNATPITKDVTIIAPTLTYENPRALAFPGEAAGVAGAQMETDVTYGPNTVSFANTFWWEKPGPGSGGTGGFARARLPYHRPNPRDLQIGSNNSGPTDRAGFWGFRPDRRTGTYSAGSFRWVIPTYYKCTGETSRQLIQNVDQVCDLAADGTVTVTKLGTPFSRSP